MTNFTDQSIINPDLTPFELYIQLFIFYLFFGLVSTIGNFLITLSMIKYSGSRTRFFIIMICLTSWRTILSIQFVIISLFRILRRFQIVSVYQTRLTCHSVHIFFYNASTIELILLIVLVVDRIMAIGFSNFYRLQTRRQAFYVCVIISVIASGLKLIPSYLGIDLHETIACIDAFSPTNFAFNVYNQYLELALAILLLIIYCGLYFFIESHVKKLKDDFYEHENDSNTTTRRSSFEKRARLVPMIRNMIFVHCAFELISKLLFTANLAGFYAKRLIAYGGIFLTLDLLANVIVLLWTNAEIRNDVWKMVFGRRFSGH